MNNQRGLILVLILIIVVILIGGGYLLYQSRETKQTLFRTPKEIVTGLHQELTKLSGDFKYEYELKPPSSVPLYWVSEDGWDIADPQALGFNIRVFIDTQNENIHLHPQTRAINEIIVDFFNNKTNLKKEMGNSHSDENLAFQKEEVSCRVTMDWGEFALVRNRQLALITVACSDKLKEAYEQKMFYLKEALNNRNSPIRVQKRVGDFVLLKIDASDVIAKRSGDKFIKIAEAAGEPFKCEPLKAFGVPEELYETCLP